MNLLYSKYAYLAIGTTITLLILLFTVTSLKEQRTRAFITGILIVTTFDICWFGSLWLYSLPDIFMIISSGTVVILGILFFLPIGKIRIKQEYQITQKVDERDTVFAREDYWEGSEKYDLYYQSKPQYKETDDKIRTLPKLLHPDGRYYDKEKSNYIGETFDKIKKMTTKVDGDLNPQKESIEPEKITDKVKSFLLDKGADAVGIANLNQMHVYSHVGRGPEKWGSQITNNHKYVIVFSLEMNYFQVEKAPQIEITEETADKYYQAAKLSVSLAEYIRSLGFSARAHISDSNYQIMLVPAAVDAGLGELGRSGYLISPKYGARIRLGGVTTDLPMVCDEPLSVGIYEFCKKCLKCADNCPPRAIPDSDEVEVRGVNKWLLNPEKCLQYWRTIGTDCGLCMKVCPFSHPPTFIHNIVRAGIKQSALARQVAILGDDLFYGRKIKVEYNLKS